MTLHTITGKKHEVNDRIVKLALDSVPAFLIDSANCADVHRFKHSDIHSFSKLFVVEAESLYRFFPTLRQLPKLVEVSKAEKVFITTFTSLFSYDDAEENKDVFEACWRLLEKLASKYQLYVAVEHDSVHEGLSKKYGGVEMGHTLTSQRIVSDNILFELQKFGKGLREEDRLIYAQLVKAPLKHLGSISYANSSNTWAFLVFAAMLEQEKKIQYLENAVAMIEKQPALLKDEVPPVAKRVTEGQSV